SSFTTNGDAGGTWSSSNTAVATVNPTTGLVTAVGAGTTSISYTINSGCGSPATASASLSVAVNTAPVVSGPTNVCPYLGNSTQVTYTANTPGASGYTWILPPNVNLISGAGTNSIVVTFNAAFGTQANKQIKVTANGVCGTSAQTIYYLLVQFPTTPAAITASSLDVCSAIANASSITFTIPKVSTATSYIWTSQAGTTVVTHPNGAGVNDTTITVTFSSGFTTSAITVTAVNDCGTSGVRSITLTRANPSTPSLISGPTNACAFISPSTTSATYTIPQQPNVTTYTWTIPVGATNVVGQGTNTISFVYPTGYTGGTISVIASNGCGTSGARSLSISTLSPATPGVIDVINTAPCPDRTYSYSVAAMPSNATSLNWNIPAAGTIVSGQGTTSISVSYPATAVAGTVSVVAVNNCGSSVTRSVEVRLPACPAFSGLQNAPAKGNSVLSANSLQVAVYPNPSEVTFNVTVNTVGSDRITVKISDVQGRVLQQLQLMPNALKQLGADLKPGTYFLEITQGNNRQVQKLIKQ
ncbi:MAG TPA: T9SS type A sorting domain-containing protein, partial [Ferruginibacter sp.]|nr:T9SS type A sorting domain-containing protein [Ferruginibacter sp.]